MNRRSLIQQGRLDLASRIFTLRGQKVILDRDLAAAYGVTTRRLNEQIKRNADRFPGDFAFQITWSEFTNLMSQNATSSSGYGGRRKLPLAFTEHGAIMAANVLKSKRAVRMSILVVRAFVELRRTLLADRELARWLRELERKVENHDGEIQSLFDAMRRLLEPPPRPKRRMGFEVSKTQVIR